MAKGWANLMKQVQKMQTKMLQIQDELEERQVEGSAGGGMVTVVANGKQDILSIKIDPEVVDPEDVEMLEDLILVAVKQALEKARALADEEMQKVTGMMPQGMMGGMKLPGLGL